MNAAKTIAQALKLPEASVANALSLMEDGNSLPFVARYRKEMIRGIDELALRDVADSAEKFQQLEKRRQKILDVLEEKKKLTKPLEKAILGASSLGALEELYRPFKSSRQTRADMARVAGLEPLAKEFYSNKRTKKAIELAKPFVDPAKGIGDTTAAIQGAIYIIAERFSQQAAAKHATKKYLGESFFKVKKKRGYTGEDRRFEDFYDHSAPWTRISGHRFLAILRGESAKALTWRFDYEKSSLLGIIARLVFSSSNQMQWPDLKSAVEEALTRHLAPAAARELVREKKESAAKQAVQVFSKNLRDLLLAAPAGARNILAVDPGFRAGCKIAVINQDSLVVATDIIYPTPPRSDEERAKTSLLRLIQDHKVELIALGNGQGSRESLIFLQEHILPFAKVDVVRVSEAGASVYSASKLAVEDLPDLDISLRGAVSIARRLQDPLAELVKIEPRSLGIGQYQHDLDEGDLLRALDAEIESCVNCVGVDLNTASAELLRHVSGLDRRVAKSIVAHREKNGAFSSRESLLPVKGIGENTFIQCAGFLRIRGGSECLDSTGIHPESYGIVRAIAKNQESPTESLLGQTIILSTDERQKLHSTGCGQETLDDILAELAEPGRDPRSKFEIAEFAPDVRRITDLTIGMTLQGTVSNVTEFGAFIDIGLDTDGLVHISEMSSRHIQNPHDVVSLGQTVRTKVLSVDTERKRIALTLKHAIGSGERHERF